MRDKEAPQSLLELLDKLVEAPEPTPVSWAPQTWGWAALALILLALAAWAVWRAVACYRANAYRRAALAELDRAGDDPALIAEILRRTALKAYPRTDVASLTGERWLRFLDAHAKAGGFAGGAAPSSRRPIGRFRRRPASPRWPGAGSERTGRRAAHDRPCFSLGASPAAASSARLAFCAAPSRACAGAVLPIPPAHHGDGRRRARLGIDRHTPLPAPDDRGDPRLGADRPRRRAAGADRRAGRSHPRRARRDPFHRHLRLDGREGFQDAGRRKTPAAGGGARCHHRIRRHAGRGPRGAHRLRLQGICAGAADRGLADDH